MKALVPAALCAVIILSGGCGTGSGGSTGSSGGVTISPITGPNHLQVGIKAPASFTYKATVSGSSNTSISWSIDNSSIASIDAATGVVTPSAATTGTITITAAANADPTKKSTLKVPVVDWILSDVFQPGVGDGVILVPADGSTAVYLISTAARETACSWAYDHLTFICQNYSVQGIMQFDIFKTDGTAAGTALVRSLLPGIPESLTIGYTGNPFFSPDGTKIVFGGVVSQSGSSAIGTFVMDSTGAAAPTLLATDPDTQDDQSETPRFTQDGKQILFEQNASVWIMDADGSNQRQLIPGPSQSSVFAPDMSAIYYTTGAGALGSLIGYVVKADADGGNPTTITPQGFTMADISPSGRFLLLLNHYDGLNGVTSVFIANLDGTNMRGLNGLSWASW